MGVCPHASQHRGQHVGAPSMNITTVGHRDENYFNAFLGIALRSRDKRINIAGERTKYLNDAKQPDFVVPQVGREQVCVDNKYDSSGWDSDLTDQCEKRLRQSWASDRPVRVAVGVVTSRGRFDPVPDEQLVEAIESAPDFRWAMWTPEGRFPRAGWLQGAVSELAMFLDRAGTAFDISDHVGNVRRTLADAASVLDANTTHRFGEILKQEAGEQSNRMAIAVMFNATVFQSRIAPHKPPIPSPTDMVDRKEFGKLAVLRAWGGIEEINYYPIIGIALELLEAIKSDVVAFEVLGRLFRTASEIAKSPNSQGLVGQIFGELIGDRKFLAAFYTLPSAAALLSELAISRLQTNWSDEREIAELRVADLACGTGALLTATYQRIAERHRTSGGKDEGIHQAMLEDVLKGCDIMPASVHLTAARLSGEFPQIDYTRTQTWVMPFGATGYAETSIPLITVGSLELLAGDTTPSLFGDGTIAITPTGENAEVVANVPHGSVNIAIMNPPFSRPTNHEGKNAEIPNPVFAAFGNDVAAQTAMAKRLDSLYRDVKGIKAKSGNASQATYFIDLAHAKLKPGGVMAIICPASIVAGGGWANTRKLLAADYEDISLITIAKGFGKAESFSCDTGMAEAILIATKRSRPLRGAPKNAPVQHVILNQRPHTVAEAIEVARTLTQSNGAGYLHMGKQNIGWSVSGLIGEASAGHPSGVARTDLAISAGLLAEGTLRLPRHHELPIPVTLLGNLGSRGPLHRDITEKGKGAQPRGPFDRAVLDDRSTYTQASWPMLWAHKNRLEREMIVEPDSEGHPREGQRDRSLRMWNGYTNRDGIQIAGATRLHINSDFRLTSQALGACLTPKPVIGGRAWPSFGATPASAEDEPLWEKALALWMNSTVGLIARWYVSNRQQEGRANLTITTIGNIPVIDCRKLGAEQLERAAASFDDLSALSLLPANRAHDDETRHLIDQTLLCDILGLPPTILDPLSTLREQWTNEPSVKG